MGRQLAGDRPTKLAYLLPRFGTLYVSDISPRHIAVHQRIRPAARKMLERYSHTSLQAKQRAVAQLDNRNYPGSESPHKSPQPVQ